MPRRYKFSHVKNGERKRKAAKQTISVCENINDLYTSIKDELEDGWIDLTDKKVVSLIRLCRTGSMSEKFFTHDVAIHENFTWEVHVHGRKLATTNSPLSSIPDKISNKSSVADLLHILGSSSVCPGNPDKRFVDMTIAHKGKLISTDSSTVAELITGFTVSCDDVSYNCTVRTMQCMLLLSSGRKCGACTKFRAQLRAMHSRHIKKQGAVSKYSNNRYLTAPQKQVKLKNLQAKANSATQTIKKLRARIQLDAAVFFSRSSFLNAFFLLSSLAVIFL